MRTNCSVCSSALETSVRFQPGSDVGRRTSWCPTCWQKRGLHRNEHTKRPVVDQHGNWYESIHEAARHLGLAQSSVSLMLSGHRTNVHGHVFKYATEENMNKLRIRIALTEIERLLGVVKKEMAASETQPIEPENWLVRLQRFLATTEAHNLACEQKLTIQLLRERSGAPKNASSTSFGYALKRAGYVRCTLGAIKFYVKTAEPCHVGPSQIAPTAAPHANGVAQHA